MDTIADQTALIQALESGNPLRQVAAARDGFVVGPAAQYADDVVTAAKALRVDAVLADVLPGLLIDAQATGLPTAGLMANIYLRPTPGCP